jgi:hypothetical protein
LADSFVSPASGACAAVLSSLLALDAGACAVRVNEVKTNTAEALKQVVFSLVIGLLWQSFGCIESRRTGELDSEAASIVSIRGIAQFRWFLMAEPYLR